MTLVSATKKLLSSTKQAQRTLRLVFPKNDAPGGVLLVANRLDAYEAMSRDFHYTVEVLSDSPDVALKDVMGKMVTVDLVRDDGSVRYFNGHVFDFRFVRNDAGFSVYDMVLLPWTAFLRYRKDNYLFHGLNVEQQTGEIFAKYEGHDWRTESLSGDEVMTDACQFDETDYNYVHRRWEALGWSYWYEHRKDGHTLVLSGDTTDAPPLDGPGHLLWKGQGQQSKRGLWAFSAIRTLASTSVTASSFDFKQPRPMLANNLTVNEQGDVPAMELYEYAGAYGFQNGEMGQTLVKRRLEEIEAASKHFQAAGDDEYAQCGRTFQLKEPDLSLALGDRDAEFLILEVRHQATNNHEINDGTAAEYSSSFTCLRKKIPWRPGRGFNSTEPRIYGLQTAIVVGPKGEEIHTDKYGRVRVQFHWDREGAYDENSSAFVRVATSWAGSSFGMVAVPRIGDEVVVSWLDGNPDRPLIVGCVPNEERMPPWTLPDNKTQTGILTRSTPGGAYENANALRFEDKKGEEQLWIHAEKNQDIEVENDETHWVGNDRKKTIDRDENVYVKRDRTETVDRDETITIHNNREERVDHDERISIGDNRTEDVGKNETLSIGQNRTKTVGKSQRDHIGKNQTVNIGRIKTETVGMASMETVGMGKMSNIGLGYNRNVGMMMISVVGVSRTDKIGKTWSLTAGDKIELKVGSSQLTLTPDAIYLSAKDIHLKAENEVHVDAPKDIHLNSGAAQPPPDFNGQGDAIAGAAGAAVGAAGLLGKKGEDHNRVKEENNSPPTPAGPSSDALEPSAESVPSGPTPPPVDTGLGADVDSLVEQSPSLVGDLDMLAAEGWSTEYGPAGGGSYANRQTKSIVLDGNLEGNAETTTRTLAHEVGHATHPYTSDLSTKEAFLQGTLADEGAATMNNIRVQREIADACGPDIGIAGNSVNHAAYNQAYDDFLISGDANAARNAIGAQFGSGEITSTTNQTYENYYGSWYDNNFPADGN